MAGAEVGCGQAVVARGGRNGADWFQTGPAQLRLEEAFKDQKRTSRPAIEVPEALAACPTVFGGDGLGMATRRSGDGHWTATGRPLDGQEDG